MQFEPTGLSKRIDKHVEDLEQNIETGKEQASYSPFALKNARYSTTNTRKILKIYMIILEH